jgi:hypothetical protein
MIVENKNDNLIIIIALALSALGKLGYIHCISRVVTKTQYRIYLKVNRQKIKKSQ